MYSRPRKITALRHDNARLVAKNNVHSAQSQYMQSLFNKLGLSILITSTGVSEIGGVPELDARLGSPVSIDLLSRQNENNKLIDHLERIQPMAFAMVSRLLW